MLARIALVGAKLLKRISLVFAVPVLLAAAACHRQPGNASAAAPIQDATPEDQDRASHDPHAMTAIDAATGDLAGFANYAGGREDAPQASHASAAAATAALPSVPLASVASGDEQVGEQSSAVPAAAPWGVPASGSQAAPSNASAGSPP